jgi:hypothetical protein
VSETIVILDEQGYHLRIDRTWHHGLTREQSRRLLLDAGVSTHRASLLLESPVRWPDPAEVEYRRTGRRHWTVDGRPVTRDGAAWVLLAAGLTRAETAHLLRIYRRCCEIEARLPPPRSNSTITEEFARALRDSLCHAVSIRVAQRWVRKHLRPARSKHARGFFSWKQRFEQDEPRRSIAPDDFTQVLKETGISVIGDNVYATEIRS